jgi:peptidoglycan hydrolase-like protein with peptidoglycan-binding domain
VLAEPVVFRADIAPVNTIVVEAPTLPNGSAAVVTEMGASIGDQVGTGGVLLAVADRPVIVLNGNTPMFRDIRPETVGSDVEQLQRALGDLGYSIEVDGRFGRETEAAVLDLYQGLGFEMLHTGGEEEVAALEEAYAAAVTGGNAAQIERAFAALDQARSLVGYYIQRGELAFLTRLPVTVVSTLRVGDTWDAGSEQPQVTVSGSRVVLLGLATPEQADQVEVGDTAVALVEESGEELGVTVAAIEANSSASEDGVRASITLVPDGPIDPSLIGVNLRVTVNADSGTEVTAVPISALFTSLEGETEVLTPDGERVAVEIGEEVGGWVEILGGVEPGDLVVIGVEP